MRDLLSADLNAVLPSGEEPACRDNRIVSAILRSKDDVPDLTNDLVVRTADLRTDNLVRAQARSELVDPNEWLCTLLVPNALLRATTNNTIG